VKLPLSKKRLETPLILEGEPITIDQIDPDLRAMIRACVIGEKPWPLFLWGTPGNGKTSAARCLLHLCEVGQYLTVRKLCEQMNDAAMGRMEWSETGRGGKVFPADYRARYLERPTLLVLDEIGARTMVTDAHYEAIMHVLDCRKNKPFIAISNLDPDALTKIYDGRIVSRLSAGTMFQTMSKDRRV